MYGHYPYDAKNSRDIMCKILTETIKWQTKAKLTPDGLDFLKKMLEHDPKKRPSAEVGLTHAWMGLANSIKSEAEADLTDVVRSAHKKWTATRQQVEPKIVEERNKKLQVIDEDFSKGIRHGKRLGETPKEEYMTKPEFVRRENKITTAPSRGLSERRTSVQEMMKKISGKGSGSVDDSGQSSGRNSKLNSVVPIDATPTPAPVEAPPKELDSVVSASPSSTNSEAKPITLGLTPATPSPSQVSAGKTPRRLSYIGNLAPGGEAELMQMYLRSGAEQAAARVPTTMEEEKSDNEDSADEEAKVSNPEVVPEATPEATPEVEAPPIKNGLKGGLGVAPGQVGTVA
jgi:serine/threonine protein kinase